MKSDKFFNTVELWYLRGLLMQKNGQQSCPIQEAKNYNLSWGYPYLCYYL